MPPPEQPRHDEGAPRQEGPRDSFATVRPILARPHGLLDELDALADAMRGYFVVQVVVSDAGNRRTHLYRSAAAAERAVERAEKRGRVAHVSLAQLMPVGVVSSLGSA